MRNALGIILMQYYLFCDLLFLSQTEQLYVKLFLLINTANTTNSGCKIEKNTTLVEENSLTALIEEHRQDNEFVIGGGSQNNSIVFSRCYLHINSSQ